MATENPLRFIGSNSPGNWPLTKDTSKFASSSNLAPEELGLLYKGQRYHGNKNTSGLSRSGSAPPSMEGSLAAFDIMKGQIVDLDGRLVNLSNAAQNCKSEEQLRSHPACLTYYRTNVNLNPRVPPPLMSWENQHLMQHIGGFGDNRKMPSFDDTSNASFFISRPALSTHNEEPEDDRSPGIESGDWTDKKTDVVPGPLSPGRHVNPIDLEQEDYSQTPYPLYDDHSYQSSRIILEQASNQDEFTNPLNDSSIGKTNSETTTPSIVVNSHTRHLCLHSVGSMLNDDLGCVSVLYPASTEKTVNLHPGQNESINGSTDIHNSISPRGVVNLVLGNIEDEMKKLRLSSDGHKSHQSQQLLQQVGINARRLSSHVQTGQSYVHAQGVHHSQITGCHYSHGQPKLPSVEVQPLLQSSGVSPLFVTGAAYGTPYYHNMQSSGLYPSHFGISGCALNPPVVTPLVSANPHHTGNPVPFENAVGANFSARASGVSSGGNVASGVDMQHLYKIYGQLAPAIQPPFPDPIYVPFYQYPSMDAYATAAPASSAYLPHQRPQAARVAGVNTLCAIKGGSVSPNYYENSPNISFLMQFPSSPLVSPVFQGSSVAGASISGIENGNIKFPFSSERNAGSLFGWQGQRRCENADYSNSDSFIEELKSNKARRFELSDIAGHIVEFSTDQHGSRFIQQKLETCSLDEKASVFKEVLPHASSLMTDVFGNYVIQKFFEHGNPEQRKELAMKLVGNVLPLSLQMYGCRVIQKALEVIELNQKTQLVQELDGNVMRCVCDQNGNHVIQKCIECILTEKIRFIISAFCGQVVTLSTHPYGCRVIQRVLEHCTDESQSQWIVDEILQSACLLAQDQYGNYVTQHVLERGKPHERSQIISKFFGQIVQMSQHKFASNVVEKCLEYGNIEERDHLIKEIVGHNEGNDNLLVMMKDQFANYVVQKILEISTDKQRQMLLDCIRVHLQALKKYTYGKHIVARVEQLCGEAAPES
ncbi:Pumilio-family RNA binding repeat [Musa troglodytarum]|uniref:Pumilio-family RNA binding repeat n=1 Tax=Musa troglodytarum TaxID=320322 RepID=A0A9E7JC19_9LILI|nr:Pumilio-family RNA binding repeat [Musa troglodytarum]URD75522.1 Pumilio-family RNA binding repeat [Musa troglodytarum]URD75524.1 Pumilio-family RNA binding repeat [Musa troglodytarum]